MGALLHHEQRKRFSKLFTEPFYLMEPVRLEADAARLAVSGSTGTSYVVRVRADGTVACTCPDAAINCRRCGCVCKHACFVLHRVLQVDGPDLSFYRTLRLDPAQRAAARARCEALSADFCQRARAAGDGEGGEDGEDGEDGEGRECPVCYEEVRESGEEDTVAVACPDCRNVMHAACMARWLARAPRPTCPCCRSVCWGAWQGGRARRPGPATMAA